MYTNNNDSVFIATMHLWFIVITFTFIIIFAVVFILLWYNYETNKQETETRAIVSVL